MTTRPKIVGMISFVPGEKFVQNSVRIVKNVREEIVVPVSSQLRRRGIVGGVQTKPDSTSVQDLSVWRPWAGSLLQLS